MKVTLPAIRSAWVKLVVGTPESSKEPFSTLETVKIRPGSPLSTSVAPRSRAVSVTVAPSATVRLLLPSTGASFTGLNVIVAAVGPSLSSPSLTAIS